MLSEQAKDGKAKAGINGSDLPKWVLNTRLQCNESLFSHALTSLLASLLEPPCTRK